MSLHWALDNGLVYITCFSCRLFMLVLLNVFAGAMDAFARGLRNAARMQHEGVMSKAKADRYKSYKSGIGAKIEAGSTSLEELEVGGHFITCLDEFSFILVTGFG